MPTLKLPISSKYLGINPSTESNISHLNKLSLIKAFARSKNDVFIKNLDLDPITEEKIKNGGTGLILELFMVKQVAG